MEATVAREHTGAPRPILGPFPNSFNESLDSGDLVPLEHSADEQSAAPERPAMPAPLGEEFQSHEECVGCIYRDVVELLAAKNSRFGVLTETLAETLEKARALETALARMLDSD